MNFFHRKKRIDGNAPTRMSVILLPIFLLSALLVSALFLTGCGNAAVPSEKSGTEAGAETNSGESVIGESTVGESTVGEVEVKADGNTSESTVGGIETDTADTTAITSLDQLKGKKVGVLTGSINEKNAKNYIPGCEVIYFNAISDLPLALTAGKIDAFVEDESTQRFVTQEYRNLKKLIRLCDCNYGLIFAKTEEGNRLCAQINEFLARIQSDGTFEEIDALWFEADDAEKMLDFSALTGENGTITMGVSTSVGYPFSYLKDGVVIGYDVDIVFRFCKEYGYDLEINDYSFAGLLAGVATGKCDLGGCGITISEERKESLLFSEPTYFSGSAVVVQKSEEEMRNTAASEDRATHTLEMSDKTDFLILQNKTIGILSGTISDQLLGDLLPECELKYLNSYSDLALALDTGKLFGYIADEPFARLLIQRYPDQRISLMGTQDDYAYVFGKSGRNSDHYRAQMNDFLRKIRENGTYQAIEDKWMNGGDPDPTVEMDDLTGENGTLRFAVCSSVGAPFCYLQNNQFEGFEVDLAVQFCREYGYDLKIVDFDFNGIMIAVSTGKCDFGAACITITQERKEFINFSDSHYSGGLVIVMKEDRSSDETILASTEQEDEPIIEEKTLFDKIKQGIDRTFVRENRWKVFLNGFGITMLITGVATACGSILGFLVFLLYRKNIKPVKVVVQVLSDIFQKTPVVVILMIFFYLIFREGHISSVKVSCVAFSFLFACTVISLLKVSAETVDRGQMEAALALGYSDTGSYLKIILPQTMNYFLPVYCDGIVNLIKATAIVGYIAVQDLTKVSDIIRSRTYDAFFPLISTAVIYFVAAWLLTLLIRGIQNWLNAKMDRTNRFLKGVKTK